MHKCDFPKFREACTLFLLAARQEGMADMEAVFSKGLVACGPTRDHTLNMSLEVIRAVDARR
jgi:hypothetical protein